MIQAPELTGVLMSNLFWLTDVQIERLRASFRRAMACHALMTGAF